MGWQDEHGRLLMRENPLRGFKAASEKNPRRAVASTDRYEAIRAVADQVTMEVRWDGPRRRQRSYLTEILDLAAGTGRRITAICSLRAEDLLRGDAGGSSWRHSLAGWHRQDGTRNDRTYQPGGSLGTASSVWRAAASRGATCSPAQRVRIGQSPRRWPGNGYVEPKRSPRSSRRRAVLSMPIAEAGQRLGNTYLCRTLPLRAAGRARWRSSGPTCTPMSRRC